MIQRTLRDHREIILVLALFIALGIVYSVTTPLFEAPDEQWHFAYVQYVAHGHGLPVQTLGKPTHLARQEGSQPPLYYLLAAAATFWIDTSDYPGIVWENPHYGYNVPGVVNDNKNLFIHTSLESFPYRGAALAIHISRLLSVLMGALAVLFTYLLTLEIFPDREFLAASVGGVVGFVPQFLFVSSAVSNDSAIVAMSALSLWMTIRLFLAPFGEPRLWDVIALGAATGLAALAKVSGLGLIVLAVLVLTYVFRRNQKQLGTYLFVFGAVIALIAGWWYLRNWLLYGELTGTEMMVRIFGARTAPLTATQLLAQLDEVWETFWVGFGWGNIRANPLIYVLLEILTALSGVGLLIGFARRRERFHVTLVKVADPANFAWALPFFVLALWIVIAFVELVRWMVITQAPHGRLFFPALPALAPLGIFGLTQLAPGRVQPIVARTIAGVFCAFAAIAPFAILQPAYAFPVSLSENDVQNLAQRVSINYDNKMKLLGYEVFSPRARPGEAIDLTLYWQSLAAMDEDYSIGIHLLDSNHRVIGARDSYPGHGLLPTRLWRAGQMIRDTYWVPIAADAPAPSLVQIQVALYTRADKRDLPVRDSQGQTITPIIGRFKIASPRRVEPRAQNATQYMFGKQIALVGFNLAKAAESAQGLNLTLYWKRIAPMTTDYIVFVHLLDSNGKIVAQKDQQPANGDNPTSLWDEGEVVIDSYALTAPTRGMYQIEAGLYRADTGERLPVFDAKGNALGDHVDLGAVEVGQ
jgi:4-amino-4-deoxy-L-arabinose transferase-like glycosyltransferase